MTDEQLAEFIGIAGEPKAQKLIDGLSPEKRALFERMARLETEYKLWQDGLGPKPSGILLDTVQSTKRRKAWR